jgi:membrane dipeptidase
MNRRWLLLLLIISSQTIKAQSYQKIHDDAVVVDTHNDFFSKSVEKGYSFDQDLKGKTHSDLQRMKQAGIDIQVFSIWCDGKGGKGKDYALANREIDSVYAVVQRNPSTTKLILSPDDLKKTLKEKKFGVMMGMEGGHMIEDDLTNLTRLYERGVRYMTLTWNNSTSWATSALFETAVKDSLAKIPGYKAPRALGLSDFGEEVVKRMNELGMMVDLSHVGEQTFWDAIQTTTKPVLVSHSCAYTLCPIFRNLKDDQIKAVGENGGVIHVNFFSGFVDSNFRKRNEEFLLKHKAEKDSLLKVNTNEFSADDYLFEKYADEVKDLRPPLSLLIDHVDYIVKLIGVNHVGLGSDFDGINSAPKGMDDVTSFPMITQELQKRGYSKKDIKKILGGNFLRLYKENSK